MIPRGTPVGAFNVPKPSINWLCARRIQQALADSAAGTVVAFAGLGLWIAPLIH